MVRQITSDNAPAAVGTYSQAVANSEVVFTSGQIPVTSSGEVKNNTSIKKQTEIVLENIKEILTEEGIEMNDILKTTILLDNIDDFEDVDDKYQSYFRDNPPARSAFEVANLPKGVGIEIEAIASLDS